MNEVQVAHTLVARFPQPKRSFKGYGEADLKIRTISGGEYTWLKIARHDDARCVLEQSLYAPFLFPKTPFCLDQEKVITVAKKVALKADEMPSKTSMSPIDYSLKLYLLFVKINKMLVKRGLTLNDIASSPARATLCCNSHMKLIINQHTKLVGLADDLKKHVKKTYQVHLENHDDSYARNKVHLWILENLVQYGYSPQNIVENYYAFRLFLEDEFLSPLLLSYMSCCDEKAISPYPMASDVIVEILGVVASKQKQGSFDEAQVDSIAARIIASYTMTFREIEDDLCARQLIRANRTLTKVWFDRLESQAQTPR